MVFKFKNISSRFRYFLNWEIIATYIATADNFRPQGISHIGKYRKQRWSEIFKVLQWIRASRKTMGMWQLWWHFLIRVPVSRLRKLKKHQPLHRCFTSSLVRFTTHSWGKEAGERKRDVLIQVKPYPSWDSISRARKSTKLLFKKRVTAYANMYNHTSTLPFAQAILFLHNQSLYLYEVGALLWECNLENQNCSHLFI